MKIFLHEIKEQDTEHQFSEADEWLVTALAKADEDRSLAARHRNFRRKANGRFFVRRCDQLILLSGNLKSQVFLLCSRCANTIKHPVHTQFSALYSRDADLSETSGRQIRTRADPVDTAELLMKVDRLDEAGVHQTLHENVDITLLNAEYVDLAEIVNEQLSLQIPFQPLCQEECKGMCAQCGANLNMGRCACEKITRPGPFSVLKDFKVK